MTDAPHRTRLTSFGREDLLACAHGELFGPASARLPAPPMLMVDRIVEISADGGRYGKGFIRAELAIAPDHWFFPCHFEGDPVMPGCLGLDALWQLIGFFLSWSGGLGFGRALGVGEVRFDGQVTPKVATVGYVVDMKRVILRKLTMGVADGALEADGRPIFQARDLKVGLFDPKDLQRL